MTVYARVRGRGDVALDPALGNTAGEVLACATEASTTSSLVGSGAPQDIFLATAGGGAVRLSEVLEFNVDPEVGS